MPDLATMPYPLEMLPKCVTPDCGRPRQYLSGEQLCRRCYQKRRREQLAASGEKCPCGRPRYAKGLCMPCYSRKWVLEHRHQRTEHYRAYCKGRGERLRANDEYHGDSCYCPDCIRSFPEAEAYDILCMAANVERADLMHFIILLREQNPVHKDWIYYKLRGESPPIEEANNFVSLHSA